MKMNKTSPKVSIVLPTYNGSKYIRQSIDSCLNQTYKNIELIIVDDGSTDETPEIINSYKDERIKYIRHNKNKGLPNALNTGFANTTGEYLTWTSDDNYYAKTAIEKLVLFLQTKNCFFVYCDYYWFHENDESKLYLRKLPYPPSLEEQNNIGAFFLYSRKIRDDIGNYDPETVLAEDYDYWIRISKKFTMCHFDEPLLFYRVHKESLYISRYYEVKVVDFLVRIKNDILDINQVTNLFVNLIAQKRGGIFKLNKLLAKILFSRKISRVLRDFKMGRISFKKARLSLILLIRVVNVSASMEIENQGSAKRIVEIDLAVCILFYEKLHQTIESIQSFLPSGVNIYVLNNGSSSISRQKLGEFCNKFDQIKIFDSDVNLGVGIGRNFLISHTTQKWLLFVDNDIVIKTQDWLHKFIEHISSNKEIEVYVPILFNVHGYKYVLYKSFRIEGNRVFHDVETLDDLTNTFPGGASFISRKLFDRLGLYDDKMFVGFEDFELSIRGIISGDPVKGRLIQDIELVHHHRQVQKNDDVKALLRRYDVNLIKVSSDRIFEKHNVMLEGEWRIWVSHQIETLTKKQYKIIDIPRRKISKIIKKIRQLIN